jgi:hypothetical protein
MITTKFSLSLAFFFYDKINLFKISEIFFPFKKQNASSYTDQRSLERESYFWKGHVTFALDHDNSKDGGGKNWEEGKASKESNEVKLGGGCKELAGTDEQGTLFLHSY